MACSSRDCNLEEFMRFLLEVFFFLEKLYRKKSFFMDGFNILRG